MNVIGHHRVGEAVDGEDTGEELQSLPHLFTSVLKRVGERIPLPWLGFVPILHGH